MAELVKVGTTDEFDLGVIRGFEIGGQQVAVVNLDGVFYAFQNRCTHLDVPLTEGFASGQSVYCYLHDSCFNLVTGAAISGPAAFNLPVYEVCIQDEAVLISIASSRNEHDSSPALTATDS